MKRRGHCVTMARYAGRDESRVRSTTTATPAHCKYPRDTSLLKDIMNKIKLIQQTADGFRASECFFVKIRAAFPGNAG